MTKDESMPLDFSPAKDDESGDKPVSVTGKPTNDTRPADKKPDDAKISDKADTSEDAKSGKSDETGDPEPEITLHQFLRISGMAQNQAAGFVRHAQRAMPGRYVLTDWKQALSDFWRAPAR